jgi:hypothetical protein
MPMFATLAAADAASPSAWYQAALWFDVVFAAPYAALVHRVDGNIRTCCSSSASTPPPRRRFERLAVASPSTSHASRSVVSITRRLPRLAAAACRFFRRSCTYCNACTSATNLKSGSCRRVEWTRSALSIES